MGLNHIYFGNGKGKTTTAVGLAVRAAGAGMNVYIFQFLKGSCSSETESLSKLENITIQRCCCEKFLCQMNEDEKHQLITRHNEMLTEAQQLLSTQNNLMIVFDEILDSYNLDVIDKTTADMILLKHYENAEIVITGRNPEQKFLDFYEYVSEINAIKHPFEHGVHARKGIEY